MFAVEDGTQHVVLGGDSVKGRLQGSFVDTFAAMQHHALQIVGGLGQAQVFEIVDDRRVTHFSAPRLLTDGNGCLSVGSGNGTHGLEFHHVGHGDVDVQLAQGAHQADGLDGVTT